MITPYDEEPRFMRAFAKGTPVIVAEGLHKSYGDTQAVIDLSSTLPRKPISPKS